MNKRIDFKILWEELREKIREFYPYFFGFYLLSLVVSIFSKTWRSFFYWPAFHGSVFFFTLLFVLTFKFDLRFRRRLRIRDLRFNDFKFVGFTKNSARKAGLLFYKYLVFIKNRLFSFSRGTWVRITIIIVVLSFSLFKEIGVLDFLVLFYALISFLFILNSRYSAGAALILLASCPFLLILKKDLWAESAAIYAYYFLVITILTQIRELKKEKNASITETEDKI